jgi:hypothetical protein
LWPFGVKIPNVTLREFFLETFAGDLEYHPRRAMLYLGLGAVFICLWIFSPFNTKFTTIPLIFFLGGLPLLVKSIFLARKSSEGLGLTQTEVSNLGNPINRKTLPSISSQAAQIFQDFGVGPLLLWPLVNFLKEIENSASNPALLPVFCAGGVIFVLGWIIRRLTLSPQGH